METIKLTALKILFYCVMSFMYAVSADTVSLHDLMEIQSDMLYTSCYDRESFNFEPFPISMWPELQPSTGMIDKTFVVQIPRGQIYSVKNIRGLIVQDKQFVEQFLWPSVTRFRARHKNFTIKKGVDFSFIPGKVAVVAQEGKAYFHWMIETLGRLALLEIFGKNDYDFLYVPASVSYQKESLQLWGIDISKVIEPLEKGHLLQADELIVPSLVCRPYPSWGKDPLLCAYPPLWLIHYIRNKFLSLPELQQISRNEFPAKIFISRKDSRLRQIINEDEVFAIFEKQGFVRYELAYMSLLNQIALFHHAHMIVGFHGSGLTNTLFCNPGTCIVEIFQERGDCTFWYMSQLLGLQHHCIKTMDFSLKGGISSHMIPVELIQEAARSIPQIFEQ